MTVQKKNSRLKRFKHVSFVISLQETGDNTEQGLRVGHQAEVPDRRVVLRGQVSQTHGQDPRLGNHPGLHETEESWFRCVGSILLTMGALLLFTLLCLKLYVVTCYPAAGYIFRGTFMTSQMFTVGPEG